MIGLLASAGKFDPAHHVADSEYLDLQPFADNLRLLPEYGLSKNVFFMLVSALICCVLFIRMASGMEMVPRRLAQRLFEPLILFIRDGVVKSNMPHDYRQFTPFFLTLFFFILFCNLLGLLPWCATPTSSYHITGALAGMVCVLQPVVGMWKQGPVKYWLSFIPHGMPVWVLIGLLPILYPIELIGLATKPFALMIRLYANMMAGHMVLLSIFGLIYVFQSFFVSGLVCVGVLGFLTMELGVAFLQAYIFTFISSLVLGAAAHPAH